MRFLALTAALFVTTAAARVGADEKTYAPLPQAVSSFGAAVADGHLYVYGGHVGKTHTYSTADVVGTFRRLNLADGKAWEDLPAGPIAQGLGLVAHGGKLYRIGGMQPRNAPGEKADNHSLASCACYDPARKAWEPLPDLPAGRSSFDAVVLGDKIYVVGGWTQNGGGQKSTWLDTALVLDLAQRPLKWESIPQPFQRRALTAAAYNGKVYVLTGLGAEKTALTVDIYDPATQTWSAGPKVPGFTRNGFAPASSVAGGRLYLSPADGKLLRLSTDGKAWEDVGELKEPRIVHRMVTTAEDTLLVLGGAGKSGNVAAIEAIRPARDARAAVQAER